MTGYRQSLPAPSPALLLGASALVVALQALTLILAAPFLTIASTAIGELVSLLGQEDRPSLASALPLATGLAIALSVVVAASAAGAVIAAAVLVIWRRTRDRGRAPQPPLSVRERAAAVGLVSASALVATVLTIVVGALAAPVEITEARGTTITVVLPSAALMASVLVVAALVIVLGSLVAPRALLAWRVTAAVEGATRTTTTHPPVPAPSARRAVRAVPWGLPVAVVALTTAFVVLAALARPISDDLRIMSLVRDLGFWEYMARHLAFETGRYSQGVANWVLVTVFGSSVNLGTALVVYLAVLAASAAALTTFLPRLRESGRSAVWWLAGGFAAVSIYLVPSIADTWLWFTAADVYMPSIAGLLFSAVLIRRSWVDQRTGWRRGALVVATLAVVLVTQGFSEATSALGWASATVLVVVAFRQGRRHPRVVSLLVWFASTAALLVLVSAPAQLARSENVDSGSIVVGILGGLYSLLPLGASLGLHGWLLIVGLALALAVMMRPTASNRQVATMAAIGAASLTLVPPMGGLVAFLGLNWVPWRTLTLPAMAFAWGVVLLASAAFVVGLRMRDARRSSSDAPHRPASRAAALAALTLTASVVASLPLVERALVASALRAQLAVARDALVVEQLTAGESEIDVHPAPLLLYPSDTRDFEFREVQNKDWFSAGYRSWFEVPATTTFVYETTQPLGYCVDDDRVIMPGVTPCSEKGAADDG